MGILIVAAVFGLGLIFALALSTICARRFCSHRDSVTQIETARGVSPHKTRNAHKQTH